jgi:hypothetical protein
MLVNLNSAMRILYEESKNNMRQLIGDVNI